MEKTKEVKKEKRTALDKKAYNRVVEMLSSSDPETKTVGMTLLESIDLKASLPAVLLLRKRFASKSTDSKEWDGLIADTDKLLKATKLDLVDEVGYNTIFKIITEMGYPKMYMEIFEEDFAGHAEQIYKKPKS